MPETNEVTETVVALRVSNSRNVQIMFYLEPWGEQFLMEAGMTFEVVAKGPSGHFLEVDYANDHITVFAWPGSVAAVFHNGVELGRGFMPVPSVGLKLSVRGFLDLMFKTDSRND